MSWVDYIPDRVKLNLHRWRLWWRVGRKQKTKQDYFQLQLNRSFSKRSKPGELRAQILIDLVAKHVEAPDKSRVLCVGARNTLELDYFHQRGFGQVTGIDLFSSTPEIIVMDMHALDFPDNTFDVIYSCHSLEHAHDASQVANEFVRVAKDGAIIAIEVPVAFTPGWADLIDFVDPNGLLEIFSPWVHKILETETHAPQTERNQEGTAIVRAVFRLQQAKVSP